MNVLNAGRELDALVAEKVMGWTVQLIVGPGNVCEEWCDPQGWRYGPDPKPYSTDIAAAWEVFEHTLIRVGYVNITADMEDWGRGLLTRGGPERVVTVTVGIGPQWTVTAAFPEAICRAALAATADVPERERDE